jgi:hypothetical protein
MVEALLVLLAPTIMLESVKRQENSAAPDFMMPSC